MNLLQHNRCKPPTGFGHLSWSSSRMCFFEEYVTKTKSQCTITKYKVLNVWFTIYVKIWNTD